MFPAVFLLLSLWSRGYGQCLQGLHTESELFSAAIVAQSQNELIVPRFQESWLFPSLVFNCTGSIYKWRVAAFNVPGNEARNGRPVLLPWRQTPGSSVDYAKNGHANFENCPVQVQGNVTVYESVPDVLLPFQQGDVLGWYLRAADIERYQPYLRRVASDLSYYSPEGRAVPTDFTIDSNRGDNVLPLMSVEICVSDNETQSGYRKCSEIDLEAERRDAADCIPTGPPPAMPTGMHMGTSMGMPTRTPLGTPIPSPSTLSRGVLIVVIVVPAAMLILLLVTMNLVVVLYYRRKKSDNHPKPYPTHPPVPPENSQSRPLPLTPNGPSHQHKTLQQAPTAAPPPTSQPPVPPKNRPLPLTPNDSSHQHKAPQQISTADEMELVQGHNDVHMYDDPGSMEVEQFPLISIQSDNYTNIPAYNHTPQGQQEDKLFDNMTLNSAYAPTPIIESTDATLFDNMTLNTAYAPTPIIDSTDATHRLHQYNMTSNTAYGPIRTCASDSARQTVVDVELPDSTDATVSDLD